MVITEIAVINDTEFAHSYSDNSKMIQKVGTEELYEEAYDPVELSASRTYVETDIDIPKPDLSSDLSSDVT